jgi:N-terminal acetyltransferase B complex non-catalytic subunit
MSVCSGAGGAAHQIYELLDVKHMQLDSLGYYHCNNIFVTGQFAVTSALYEATLKFFTGNYKDVSLNISYKFYSTANPLMNRLIGRLDGSVMSIV